MNSRDLLLAGKARMSKEMRSFQFGGKWYTLKKDETTGTGCNIYFDRDNAWLKGRDRPLRIHEEGIDMLHIADAVVVWFVHYDEALRILAAYD
jgi:hypothetical protein